MADNIKISALDELVSGSVAGTTIIPVVDGGVTYNAKMSSVLAYMGDSLATNTELTTAVSNLTSTINGLDTDNIDEAANLYYTDARVKTKMDAEQVLSGSFPSDFVLTVDGDAAPPVSPVATIVFDGATVTDDGGGTVTVNLTPSLTVTDDFPTSVSSVSQINFSGATVTNSGGGVIGVAISAQSGDSVAMMTHTASVDYSLTQLVTFTSSISNTISGVNLQISEYTSSVDAHILDVATFTSSFSSSVESRIVTLEAAGDSAIPDGTISGSQQITDFGFFSSSLDIESKLVFIPGASLSITSESNGDTLDISIDVFGGPGGGTGDVSYTNGFHIISQSTSTLASNAILSEMYVDANENITFTQFSSSLDTRFGSGGGSDYISNVSFGNNTLSFTGNGFGFNGNVTLSNGIVSSSAQINTLGFLSDSDVTQTYLSGKLPNIISGSQQISDLGFLGTDSTVLSSSAQVILTQANSSSFTTYFIPEETNLYYTDERVKTKMDVEGVISSSAQISVPIGTVSGSSQIDYAELYNKLELRSGSNAILITSGTAGYGTPYITIGLDGTAFASIQTEIDFGTLSDTFYGADIPSSSAQLTALGAVANADLIAATNQLNGFTGSLGGFGVASSSLASRITSVEAGGGGGISVEAGYQLISQSNSATNLILDLVRINSTDVTTFNDFSASVASGVGAGSSTFASLTDTEFSSFVGGDLVKYNATTEKWENTLQLNGAYVITGSLFVTGGAVTADSFVAGDVGTPIIDSATSLDISAGTEVYISSTGNGVVIEDIMVLNKVIGDAPTSPLTGSLMNSGSVDDDTKLWFFNGTLWKEIAFV